MRLLQSFLGKILTLFPNLSFDRFADNKNKKFNKFNSKYFCPETSGVNAFYQNWHDEINFIFPPVNLLGRALDHLKICKGEGLFVVPQWNKPYWPQFNDQKNASFLKYKWEFKGQNKFFNCSDKKSVFNRSFQSNVNLFYFNFKMA